MIPRRSSSSASGVEPVVLDTNSKKIQRQQSNSKPMNLLQREAEYKKLNEELEAKTTSLFQETETMLRQQEAYLAAAEQLERAGPDFYADPSVGTVQLSAFNFPKETGPATPDSLIKSRTQSSSTSKLTRPASKPTHYRSSTAPSKTRPKSQSSLGTRSTSREADDVALVDDPVALLRDVNLEEAFERIAHDVDDGDDVGVDDDDDILPLPAQDMGYEAKVRFLKAKVRVLQEEVDKMSSERTGIESDKEKLAAKAKAAEEDRMRLQKASSSQQAATLKQKQALEDIKTKLTSAESQISTLKRQNDQLQRDLKAQQNNTGATEVRLNRASEEIEKLKAELAKAKSSNKENLQDEKKRMESLMAENRRLEKQKTDLIQGFRKQARLIDILKRQKMHLEAAKMLQFTEEEFVKALEWGSG